MPDDESLVAMMYGPLVLAGRFDAVGDEQRYGDYEPKAADLMHVPTIDARRAWLEPDRKERLLFRSMGQSQDLTLVPLFRILRERYAVYWKVDPAAPA
jgi:hypothetical protein